MTSDILMYSKISCCLFFFSVGRFWNIAHHARWRTAAFCAPCLPVVGQLFSCSVYWASRVNRRASIWLILWSWSKDKVCPSERSTLYKLERQIRVTMKLFLLTSKGNVLNLCFPVSRNVCKILGPM